LRVWSARRELILLPRIRRMTRSGWNLPSFVPAADVIWCTRRSSSATLVSREAFVGRYKKEPMAKGFRKRFQFISDIINELKKVMWPSREELMRLTLMVLGVCLVTAVVLGIVDYAFGRLVREAIGGG